LLALNKKVKNMDIEKTLDDLNKRIKSIEEKINLFLEKLEIEQPKPYEHIVPPEIHSF